MEVSEYKYVSDIAVSISWRCPCIGVFIMEVSIYRGVCYEGVHIMGVSVMEVSILWGCLLWRCPYYGGVCYGGVHILTCPF